MKDLQNPHINNEKDPSIIIAFITTRHRSIYHPAQVTHSSRQPSSLPKASSASQPPRSQQQHMPAGGQSNSAGTHSKYPYASYMNTLAEWVWDNDPGQWLFLEGGDELRIPSPCVHHSKWLPAMSCRSISKRLGDSEGYLPFLWPLNLTGRKYLRILLLSPFYSVRHNFVRQKRRP